MIKDWFLGSRKFLVMLAVILIGASFRITGLISGSDMVSLYSSVGVAFMGANTVERMMITMQDWIKTKVSKPSEEGE